LRARPRHGMSTRRCTGRWQAASALRVKCCRRYPGDRDRIRSKEKERGCKPYQYSCQQLVLPEVGRARCAAS
jgi:hypothetical protein